MKYIVIALIFLSCNIPGNKNRVITSETLDTIKLRPVHLNAKPTLLEAAFIKGTTHRSKSALASFYGITIGNIKIPSGRIISCDPLHVDEYGIPFTQVFPTGEFPVQLSIIKVENEETIAFARILFSDKPVERWEMALQEGQKPVPMGEDDIQGYSVDAGIGIFLDAEARKVLNTDSLTEMTAPLYKEMDKHYHYNWRYGIHSFDKYNMAAFTTGLGDGYFASYVGFDATGKPCRLVTDFNLLDWRKK